MKNLTIYRFMLFAAVLFIPVTVSAQPYEITQYVIASGGGSDSNGTSGGHTFVLDGTVGQNLAGTTSAGIDGGGYFIVQGGFWAADFIAPTAALVSVSGRVLSSNGRALPLARVILTAPDGSMRSATASSFGLYSIGGLEAGQTYILTAKAKGFVFAPLIVTLNENVTGLDMTAF